jgi:hypothetical protein
MSTFIEAVVTIALAIVGLAIVSVLVSRNAQTPAVIQSAASGFANSVGVAQSPVTGSKLELSLGYPAANSHNYGFGQ